MNGLNDASILNVRNVVSGKDGQLFVSSGSNPEIFLAEVDEFKIIVNFKNKDLQPVGSALEFSLNLSYSVSLTFSEIVVRDDVLLKPLFDDLALGFFPYWEFQGKLRRRDDQFQRVILRDCIPDNSVDLMSIKPGEFVKRKWSFRVNNPPELQAFLK